MTLKVLQTGNPDLKIPCEEVTNFTEDNKELMEEIKQFCLERQAFAVSAPQLGIHKRFIYMATTDENVGNEDSKNKVKYIFKPYFNPQITKMEGRQYYYEACMSVPDACGKVARPYLIEFTAQDINGNFVTKTVSDFDAIVYCHEIDHLDGIEFTDKSVKTYTAVNREERMAIRKKDPRVVITKTGEFDQSEIPEKFSTKIYKK